MKKILFILVLSFVFVTPTMAVGETTATEEPVVETRTGLECIADAIDTRDEAIVDAFDSYYTTAKASLEKRVADLKTAWATEKGTYRKADIKDVWSTYKKEIRIANKELRTAKKAAWDAFKKEKVSCSVDKTSESSTSAMDTLL